MLLVCNACPVSVSVRLACSAERDLRGTRDTTPGLCSVHFAACHGCTHSWRRWRVPVGSLSIELSHFPRLRGARVAREIKRRSLRNGQGTNRIARLYGVTRQGARHWVAELENRLETRAVACSVRIVTISKLPVTTLPPQTNCRRTAVLPQGRD
jgi:hypothetical protein